MCSSHGLTSGEDEMFYLPRDGRSSALRVLKNDHALDERNRSDLELFCTVVLLEKCSGVQSPTACMC